MTDPQYPAKHNSDGITIEHGGKPLVDKRMLICNRVVNSHSSGFFTYSRPVGATFPAALGGRPNAARPRVEPALKGPYSRRLGRNAQGCGAMC